MAREAYVTSSTGGVNQVKSIHVHAGGAVKTVKAAWVHKPNGTSQWWPPVAGPGVPPATSHQGTVAATIVRGVAHWTIPSGRTVTHQTVYYFTGLHTAPSAKHKTVSASARSATLLAGAWGATVRYTYT